MRKDYTMKYTVVYGFGRDHKWNENFANIGDALRFAKDHSEYAFSELIDNKPVGKTNIIWTTTGIDGPHFEGTYLAELAAAESGLVIEFEAGDRVVF